jgi:hypothetical protein
MVAYNAAYCATGIASALRGAELAKRLPLQPAAA